MITTHHRGIAELGGHPRPVHIWSYLTADQIEAATGEPVDVAHWIAEGWATAVAADYWTYDPADWSPPEQVPAGLALDVLLYVQTAEAGGDLVCVAHLRDDEGVSPVGAAEIAERLGVQPDTVYKWQTRGVLPSAGWTVGGRPAWDWAVIEAWARRTGR